MQQLYAKVALGGGAAVKTSFSAEDDAAVLEWSNQSVNPPQTSQDVAALAPQHQQALLARSRGDIQQAMYAKVALGGGAAVKSSWTQSEQTAAQTLADAITARTSIDRSRINSDINLQALSCRSPGDIIERIAVLQGRRSSYGYPVEEDHWIELQAMIQEMRIMLRDQSRREEHMNDRVVHMLEQMELVIEVMEALQIRIDPGPIHVKAGLANTKETVEWDQFESSSLDIVCEALLLLINEHDPSRNDLIQLVQNKQTRRPWQKYEKQSAAVLKHMYGQGFVCVETDFFAPAKGVPFHLDAGPNTHRCAVYSDKRFELHDFYIEQGVLFEQVLRNFSYAVDREVFVHTMYRFSGDKSLKVGDKDQVPDAEVTVSVCRMRHVSNLPLTAAWQLRIVRGMLLAANVPINIIDRLSGGGETDPGDGHQPMTHQTQAGEEDMEIQYASYYQDEDIAED